MEGQQLGFSLFGRRNQLDQWRGIGDNVSVCDRRKTRSGDGAKYFELLLSSDRFRFVHSDHIDPWIVQNRNGISGDKVDGLGRCDLVADIYGDTRDEVDVLRSKGALTLRSDLRSRRRRSQVRRLRTSRLRRGPGRRGRERR
jgi:hypothetical protein